LSKVEKDGTQTEIITGSGHQGASTQVTDGTTGKSIKQHSAHK